ncbi:SDR family NAD(P)-dependent oxidoreductase [Pseudomonas violetae]|uniref:SDR family oxidoreductase n=1 Tax=Pseudomonas violetae TaxID=2915813 RepID=A0ABT0ESX2_9PSED|nr:SDR family oxidoreductase [Pseudomonas violetae]MCK1788841.1 SDR family oxidoreductase [Pseudomonas violetae]
MIQANAQYPSLFDRTVFITGGGSGIGAALTRAFHLQGARVAFIDIAEEASLQLVAELEAQTGRTPWFRLCDIRNVPSLQAAIHEAGEALGPIRVLVNNAARDDRHDWREVDTTYWDNGMAINLRPLFFAIQAAAPQMITAGGGSIINFGSISVQLALGGLSSYVSAKAAVHGLTRSLARDLGAEGIRVNTVVPGCIMTERQLEKWITPADEARIQEHQCLKLRLLPEHVAPIVMFLASDDSAQLTAHEFPVDGGWG